MTTKATAAHAADADREMLVFGVSGESVLHISEVARGAACGCVCPGCGAALVAKQGAVVEHHFAHASGQDCQTACESAIHLFAKRAFAEHMRLALPDVVLSGQTGEGTTITVTRPGATEAFDRVLEEDRRRQGFIPDAVGFQGADETIVEFAFTHLVGENKLELIKAADLRAVEIYLSAVNTAADLAAIAQEILFKAPRKWLWHPSAQMELSAKIERANEGERLARIASELAEEKTRLALMAHEQDQTARAQKQIDGELTAEKARLAQIASNLWWSSNKIDERTADLDRYSKELGQIANEQMQTAREQVDFARELAGISKEKAEEMERHAEMVTPTKCPLFGFGQGVMVMPTTPHPLTTIKLPFARRVAQPESALAADPQ